MADLMEEDPARAIRNAVARIRLHLTSDAARELGVDNVSDCLEPELEILERCAASVEHVRVCKVTPVHGTMTPAVPAGLWFDPKKA